MSPAAPCAPRCTSRPEDDPALDRSAPTLTNSTGSTSRQYVHLLAQRHHVDVAVDDAPARRRARSATPGSSSCPSAAIKPASIGSSRPMETVAGTVDADAPRPVERGCRLRSSSSARLAWIALSTASGACVASNANERSASGAAPRSQTATRQRFGTKVRDQDHPRATVGEQGRRRPAPRWRRCRWPPATGRGASSAWTRSASVERDSPSSVRANLVRVVARPSRTSRNTPPAPVKTPQHRRELSRLRPRK